MEEEPRELYADSAYDTESIRRNLESIWVEPNTHVNTESGRKPKPYNIKLYKKMRSTAERFFR